MPQDSKAGRTHSNIPPKPSPEGVNWLFVIAIDEYQHCAKLGNCVNDAKKVIKVLQEKYQFEQVIELYNEAATKTNIVAKLNQLSEKIRKDVDNLILYFSGHGETEGNDTEDDEQIGYLIPVEAARGDESQYIPHLFFRSKLNRIRTKHTFLVIDACFAGSFFYNIRSEKRTGSENLPSRWGISSSSSHEVAFDGAPGDNSPFATCLLAALEANTTPLDIHGLAAEVENRMQAQRAKQTPICLPFSDPNKYNGQFYFHPKQNEASAWAATEAAGTADAYYDFWQKYRSNLHAEEALWRYACKRNQVADYQLYRKQYPKGKYRYEALDKMDDAVFANATNVHQLRQYLENFGEDARHAEEAQQRMDDILAGIVIKPPKQENSIITPPEDFIIPEPPRLAFEPEMVLVPGGTFQMGSNDISASEKPIHSVTVSDFYIGKYEVTFEEYDAFCTATKREKPEGEGWERGKRPVINVSWEDATAYCKWLSEKTGKKYRLPTEAEWEYAARGGAKSKGYEYSGSDEVSKVAVYNTNKTQPVGGKIPNELGLYDMSGNVYEWCSDWYGEKYYGENGNSSNPKGPSSGIYRVLRGGSWGNYVDYCRVAVRGWDLPVSRGYYSGFRLAQDK